MKRAFEILPPLEMAGFSVLEETSNISSGGKTWILSIAGMSIVGSADWLFKSIVGIFLGKLGKVGLDVILGLVLNSSCSKSEKKITCFIGPEFWKSRSREIKVYFKRYLEKISGSTNLDFFLGLHAEKNWVYTINLKKIQAPNLKKIKVYRTWNFSRV